MKKIASLAMLCFILLQGLAHADEFFEAQLNSGIRNSDVYSYLLLQEAGADKGKAGDVLNIAAQFSPDLPAVYFEIARAKLTFSFEGILTSVDYLVYGIDAYARNFWWSFTLAGGAFFGLVLSFILAAAAVAIIRLVNDLPLISHETGESKKNLMPLIVLFVLALISPFLLLAGILILLGLYMTRMDKAVVYLYLLVLLFSPLLFRTASYFLDVSSSGTMKAIVAVNESRDNTPALTSLGTADEPAGLFSFALALKRAGRFDDALAAYSKLVAVRPDARTYVNLGNAYVGMNRLDDALKSYLSAVDHRPLASAYYNASQISREIFDFEKGDEYFRKALEVDRYAVSRYRAIAGRNLNRLVADETVSFSDLWHLAKAYKGGVTTFGTVAGSGWVLSGASLLLMVGFYFLTIHARNKAYRCRRCNSIFCPRCEKHIMWGQMCPQCFRSLIKLDESDVKERVATLLSIYEHQKRRKAIMKVLCFLLPGASQVFGGRVLYGFLFLWPFLFFMVFPIVNGLFAGGLMISHKVLNGASFIIAVLLYIFSVAFTRQRISKGWL